MVSALNSGLSCLGSSPAWLMMQSTLYITERWVERVIFRVKYLNTKNVAYPGLILWLLDSESIIRSPTTHIISIRGSCTVSVFYMFTTLGQSYSKMNLLL